MKRKLNGLYFTQDCPFCGAHTPTEGVRIIEDVTDRVCWAECTACGARGPQVRSGEYMMTDVKIKLAIEQWNQRRGRLGHETAIQLQRMAWKRKEGG